MINWSTVVNIVQDGNNNDADNIGDADRDSDEDDNIEIHDDKGW